MSIIYKINVNLRHTGLETRLRKVLLMKAFFVKARYVLIAILAVIVVFACLLGFGVIGGRADVIAEGVSVSGIELGGMTVSQAKTALEGHAAFSSDMVLDFECEGTKFNLPASQISLKADVEKTVENAYAIGRGKDKKKNNEDIKKAKNKGYPIYMSLSYDTDKLILTASENLGDAIVDPSPMLVEIGEDKLIITNAITGIVVDTKKASLSIEKELSDFKADHTIKLYLTEYTPDNLTFDEFKKQYVKEAKDAVYSVVDGTHNIESEVIGVEIDESEARKIFMENANSKEPYEIPAKITYPEITASYLEDKYVNKIMAKYTTSFAGSSAGRCANIALAASKINGYVVNPGQRFSYNDVVGPRTAAAGFKTAHVYVGTKVVDGIGGGICQVSSTLYNAVVLADLKTVTRVNHSMPVDYVPLGRDATVSYGTIDYVFENNKPYPISVKATVEGTTLTISIVGTSEMDYTVEFVTRYISTVPFSETTTEDDTLFEGETKVITPGTNGSVYESYRVYKKDGKEYDRKFESKSRYQPVAKEVAVGTKKEDDLTGENTENGEIPNEEILPEDVILPSEENENTPPVTEDEPLGDINDEIVHPEKEEGSVLIEDI